MEKDIIRIYKTEEIELMNCIFGKEKDNKVFTLYELQLWNTGMLGGAK